MYNYTLIRMKKVFFILIPAVILSLLSCSPKKPAEEKKSAIDTIPMMVMQIQKCTRLYTAEAHVHKIITHDDQFKLKGSFLKHEFNIPVPGSNRKVAIPLDATIKAYVDFQGFSDRNVSRKGDKIEIILPDPKMVLTSTRIDHKKLKQYVSLTRSNYSDAELTQLEQQGRESIIRDIPNLDLMEQARVSAANTLIPMLKQMGFREENIQISFRKKFTLDDIRGFLQNSGVEKKDKN